MQAVILAGGMGKRLLPLTADRPKHLLSIGGKPLLERTIEALSKSGISDIKIVVCYRKEQIIEYFGDGSRLGVSIEYLNQENPKGGTADAVRCAEGRVNGRFLLLNGDILFDQSIIGQMLLAKGDGLVACRRVTNQKEFGVLEVKDGMIAQIVEKSDSPPSDIANLGIYVLPEEIFNAIGKTQLSKRGEYELTDSINILIRSGIDFRPVMVDGFWMDIGRIEDYEKANRLYGERAKNR